MCYYTQYKRECVHNVRLNNVHKRVVCTIAVHIRPYNLKSELNGVGPDSRQVPYILWLSIIAILKPCHLHVKRYAND